MARKQGQRKVGELIARVAQGGIQVIVETHSDHILNGIRLAVKQNVLEKEKAHGCRRCHWRT